MGGTFTTVSGIFYQIVKESKKLQIGIGIAIGEFSIIDPEELQVGEF